MFNWVPTVYMGKPEIPVRKSNGSRYSVRTVRQGSENNLSAVICGDAIFLKIFLGFSAHLDELVPSHSPTMSNFIVLCL